MTTSQDLAKLPGAPETFSSFESFSQPPSFATDVIDSIASRIGVLDENDRFIAVNRAWRERSIEQGMPAGYPVGSHLHDLTKTLPRRYARIIDRGFLAVVEGRRAEFSCAYPVPSRGEDDWFKQSFTRMVGEGAARYIVIIQSVQEIKRAERRLRTVNAHLLSARALAETATRAKLAFLSMMSHEMRTPLNGVLGMAQVMGMGPLSGEQRGALEVIQTSGQVLLGLLTDLLDLSKLESGDARLQVGVIDGEALGDYARESGAALLRNKPVAFCVSVEPAASRLWTGDEKAVRQVLHCLLSNAVKFTAQGEIEVRVTYCDDCLVLQVQDTGIGIPASKLEGIFERFTQADGGMTRRYDGAGLGLSICRNLVALMGGEIEVDSVVQVGTTFRVTIPTQPAGAGDPAPRPV